MTTFGINSGLPRPGVTPDPTFDSADVKAPLRERGDKTHMASTAQDRHKGAARKKGTPPHWAATARPSDDHRDPIGGDPRPHDDDAAELEPSQPIAQSKETGAVLRMSAVTARVTLVDIVRTMAGQPPISEAEWNIVLSTLPPAFEHLGFDAQHEWVMSDLRLRKVTAMIRALESAELTKLSNGIADILTDKGPWVAELALGMAAHMYSGEEQSDLPAPVSLLKPNEALGQTL